MHLLRRIFLSLSVILFAFIFSCQQKRNSMVRENYNIPVPASAVDSSLLSIDKSPMDMVYFPVDYPKEKMVSSNLGNPLVRVIYSRPKKNGRIIFADSAVNRNFIQRYGEDWRLGANEATEIEFFKNATVGNKKIASGRYIMYCIPQPGKWKIIFNSNLFSWGLHMDKSKDIADIDLPVVNSNNNFEFFTIQFISTANGCNMVMAWDNIKVTMPISFN